jgi:hypothetical protein
VSRRTRRIISRVCIAGGVAGLALVVFVPWFRHNSLAHGAGLLASSVVCILASLYYLHSARRSQ